jgi:hypothetical protein
MLKKLRQYLQAAGKALELFETPDGTRLLMLPYGARLLGLFSAKGPDSFFWNNPRLEQDATARAMFAGDDWHNTGGDRTWIAPELDAFFPDAKSNAYLQPRQLDMSDYDVERPNGGFQFSRPMTLHLARANRDVDIRLTKWFGPADNPLRHERDMAAANAAAEYAGYTQRVTMQSLGKSADPPSGVGIWNLIQLPAGGEFLVPLYSRTTPQKCFGEMPADRVMIEDHILRVRADFGGSHKIALKATALTGRVGYAYSQADCWSLVIRNFFVNPSGQYIDVQRHDPDDYGYAVQICRVDEPQYGSFCELEYHAPAIGALPDPARSEDTSQVWAFRGPRHAIDAIARKLLGGAISS